MYSVRDLWFQYHSAIANKDLTKANAIMRKIQSLKASPPTERGGCAKCKRRLF